MQYFTSKYDLSCKVFVYIVYDFRKFPSIEFLLSVIVFLISTSSIWLIFKSAKSFGGGDSVSCSLQIFFKYTFYFFKHNNQRYFVIWCDDSNL